MTLAASFASDYFESQALFSRAASKAGCDVHSVVHPTAFGEEGQTLSTDWLVAGDEDASDLVILSSGMHGVEGLCGSGCQIAILNDAALLHRMADARVALAMVHAINPFGFSRWRRGDEDNVDLNRNFRRFPKDLPDPAIDADYLALHPLLVPDTWPPSPNVEKKLNALREDWGRERYRRALMAGQSVEPSGLFYTGKKQQWCNSTLRSVLREIGTGRSRMTWIDLHSGLGPCGQGEKIYSGRSDPHEFARARATWGMDVLDPFDPTTVASPASGIAGSCIYEECEGAEVTNMALEFGTVEVDQMLRALRGSHWLLMHAEASASTRIQIEQDVRDAFYVDSECWRGMVVALARTAVMQACHGFERTRVRRDLHAQPSHVTNIKLKD